MLFMTLLMLCEINTSQPLQDLVLYLSTLLKCDIVEGKALTKTFYSCCALLCSALWKNISFFVILFLSALIFLAVYWILEITCEKTKLYI